MNTHGHTPGPWTYNGINHAVYAVYDESAYSVANCTKNAVGTPEDHADANCRLIAAAPELLAALKRAVPWLGLAAAENLQIDCANPGDLLATLDRAAAAIAKTEGR